MTAEEMLQMKSLMEEVVAPIKMEVTGLKSEIAGVKTEVTGLKSEIAGVKTEVTGLKSEIAGVKTEVTGLKSEIAGVKTEVTGLKSEIAEIQLGMSEMKAQITDLDQRVTRIGAYQETVITKSIDALAEGHDIIYEKMRELATREELEDVRGDITLLKTVVGMHSREIEALKKAQ